MSNKLRLDVKGDSHKVNRNGQYFLPEVFNFNECIIKDKDISWIDDLANDPDLITKKYKARHKN